MDALECYASDAADSDDDCPRSDGDGEVAPAANTTAPAATFEATNTTVVMRDGDIEMVEIVPAATAPAAAARAAARASGPTVNPFARLTGASKRSAVAMPHVPLRAPALAGDTQSLADAAAAVTAANAALAEAQARAGAEEPDEAEGTSTGPKMAAIERPHVVAIKPATKGGTHRGSGGIRKSTEPKVTAHQRVAEFPGQGLKVIGGLLYCEGCKANLPLIKSSITNHASTGKHIEKLAKFLEQSRDDDELKVFLVEYFTEHSDYEGADVDPEVKVDRYRVVEAMMDAGVAISIIDRIRPLLERGGASLTHSSHLRMFIPMIEAKELEFVIEEMGTKPWSLTLDATRREGEALAGVARWCDELETQTPNGAV